MWDTPVGRSLENQVGARVRQLRTAQSLSQAEVAKRMAEHGFTWRQTTMAKTEAAERPIRVNEAAALAVVLGVSILDLFDPAKDDDEFETLQEVLQTNTAVTVAMQRVAEAETALEAERDKLHEARETQEQATRKFHEARGIDHDEVQRGVDR